METEGRQQVVALAEFFVGAFEADFPEGRGLDGESSALCAATDIAEVLAQGGDPLSMLAEPGLFEAHDKLRAALAQEDADQLEQQVEERLNLDEIVAWCDDSIAAHKGMIEEAKDSPLGRQVKQHSKICIGIYRKVADRLDGGDRISRAVSDFEYTDADRERVAAAVERLKTPTSTQPSIGGADPEASDWPTLWVEKDGSAHRVLRHGDEPVECMRYIPAPEGSDQ